LSNFFNIIAADPYALFASLRPAPKGSGEVVLRDGPDDPPQLFWKLSWVVERPASSDFTLRKRKK
jgi:hypothetical protein